MLRLWIALFNRGGIAALITKARPGRRRKVKLARVRDLLLPVLENPATVGQGGIGPPSNSTAVDTDVFQCFLDEFAKAVPKKESGRQGFIWATAA